MHPLTVFSWGYWGWGNATAQLLAAVDAVEASRGFAPPVFVDTRISRSVRAVGFNGNAFAAVATGGRYRWMSDLGNLVIRDGGHGVRIKNPAAAETLLELALAESEHRNRRVLFFCSCETPGAEGRDDACHRVTVARLVREAAARRGRTPTVVEWPGGDVPAEAVRVRVPDAEFAKVRRGAKSVRLGDGESLAAMAALPWYSPVAVYRETDATAEPLRRLVGPARYAGGGWYLPVLAATGDERALRAEKGYGDVPQTIPAAVRTV